MNVVTEMKKKRLNKLYYKELWWKNKVNIKEKIKSMQRNIVFKKV